MRCRKHLNDFSNNIGVCASCLRERLFSLVAAQEQENRRTSEPQPSQPVFPRSVSPYVCRRKSDSGDFSHDKRLSEQLFFSTPQVRPTTAFDVTGSVWKRKKDNKPFSFLRRLFRSKSDTTDSVSNPRDSYASSSSSPSWFASMLSSKRKKKSRLFSLDESTGRNGGRTMTRYRDRGMSPVRGLNGGVDEEEWSGYSSESSQGFKHTPRKVAQSVRRSGVTGVGRMNHSLNVSGLNFCLSPLVRASPSRQWSQKGIPSELAFSGELKVPAAKFHLSNANANANAASFRPSRSRKLADFGRTNNNH
ncbi:uncharacterized protein LOC124909979 [Impatiens glandulifera]|uniref:uncharacterized protein LOC124909979 n=1 Tax=Impatiens glandulifera TaxID=253017 RepID=UPI001FB19D8E|nr:uncharacterized protein LOC124909979 [Impatiens glandulifera]